MKKTVLFLVVALISSVATFSQNAISVNQISKNGNPILFFPHIGCSSEMWNEVANELAKENSVYLIDLAGFNGKEAIESNFTQNFILEVQNYIENKNLNNITFIGQNYGAFVAYQIANKLPERTKAFVASDFYPKLSMVLGNPGPEKLNQFIGGIRQMKSIDEQTFENSQRQTAIGMNFINTKYVDTFVEWQKKSDRNTISEVLVEQLNGDLIPMFEKNTFPSLIFNTWFFAKEYQKLDIREAEPMMNSMYPNAKNVTHKITTDAKDFIANDQPEWFLSNVNEFLKNI